ncbi:MAG: arsenate reductase (glutaredoxin) [Prolixibacteraceae bacterium]|jgi:arsenate reductase|nr:arsenate reductase (glutaredoxin) [Prolixibacteraceae bacterium]
MIIIYHNARCSKSRIGLAYLEEKGVEYEVRQYLKEPFTLEELKTLIAKTGLKTIDIVRTDETYFKENLKGKELTDDELIDEMVKEPKLIQRPIVEKGNKAVMARPVENIDQLL